MKILFISLGCDKNLVDSERMLGLLEAGALYHDGQRDRGGRDCRQYLLFHRRCQGRECPDTFWRWQSTGKHGPCKALIVTGCLAQRYRQEIIDEIPEVDAVLGTTSL